MFHFSKPGEKFNLFFCASFLFLITICIVPVISAQVKDEEIIKVDSTTVLINATITGADGKAAAGLKQSQFKIFEDGKEQSIDFFQAEKTPFAAIILLDTSGSMEMRVSLARSAAINFLDGLRDDDAVAIYNFDSKVSVVQDFSNSRDVAEKVFDLKSRRKHGFK